MHALAIRYREAHTVAGYVAVVAEHCDSRFVVFVADESCDRKAIKKSLML